MPSSVTEQRDRILIELDDARKDGAAVTVMSRDLLVGRDARFVAVTDEAAVVELAVHETDAAFLAPAFCVVSVVSKGRSSLFTSRVKHNVSRPGFPTRLALEIPQLIRRSDQRLAVRAAVSPNVEIDAELELPDTAGRVRAKVVDLSLCGALVEVGDPSLTLVPDQRLFVELGAAEQRVRLRALVRRVSPPRFGIYFPDAVVSSRLEPPPVLRELVTRLLRA
jgi:hypothetical protein